MNKQTAAQVFSAIVIAIMVLISFYPPSANAATLFVLGAGFLGVAQRHLFDDAAIPPPTTDIPPTETPVTTNQEKQP